MNIPGYLIIETKQNVQFLQCKKVHFHIFPRTAEITERFLELHPNAKDINGPQIFDRARNEYRVAEGNLSKEVINTAKSIWIRDGL